MAGGEVADISEADRAFQHAVAATAHSVALELMVSNFYRSMDLALDARGRVKRSTAQMLIDLHRSGRDLPHRRLAEAIAAGDVGRARAIARRVMAATGEQTTRRSTALTERRSVCGVDLLVELVESALQVDPALVEGVLGGLLALGCGSLRRDDPTEVVLVGLVDQRIDPPGCGLEVFVLDGQAHMGADGVDLRLRGQEGGGALLWGCWSSRSAGATRLRGVGRA